MKRLKFIASLLPLLLSACGSKAPPTPDLAQIQASAVAAASTMIAMTVQAMPTPTPIPTDTPTSIASPTILPTLPPIAFATTAPLAAATGTTDPCDGPLSAKASGPNARAVLIVNENKLPVVLSLYLEKTPFGECGYRGFNLAPKSRNLYGDVKVGCWEAFAIVGTTGPGISKAFSVNPLCITDDTQKWEIDVGPEVVSLVVP